jgi:hypothetical protein
LAAVLELVAFVMIASFLVVVPPGSAAGAVGKPVGRSEFRSAGLPAIRGLVPGRTGSKSGSRLTPGSDAPPTPRWTAPDAASAWDIQHTPNGHVRNGTFSAVSCTAPTACTAVGVYVSSSGTSKTLAERWNGTAWTIQPTPNPTGARSSRLDAVSCTTLTACTAVGGYASSSGTSLTLAEAWNGTTWTIQPTPNPTGVSTGRLDAVSCTTLTACTAVGYYATSSSRALALAEAWNGTTWTIQPTPSPTGVSTGRLSAVSCTTPTACTAVGYYITTSNQELAVAEAWNGTAWTIQPTPSPTGAAGTFLDAVSCTTLTACTAAGQYSTTSSQELTLAEAWNGTTWTIQPTPNPTDTTFSLLDAVSCTTLTACTAVGRYIGSSGASVTLAERWNGTAWAIQPTPDPAGGTNGFPDAVSCTTLTACTAVGGYTNSSGASVTLAEAWNGTAWAIQPTPDPTGAGDSFLDSVSCTTTTTCTAVGRYYTNSPDRELTLAERWNGTAWTTQLTPNPTGATQSRLDAVSCTASTTCTAVGEYINSSGASVTLAERWNGTNWAIQPIPSPAGAGDEYLDAVSCTAPTACAAVGQYHNSSGVLATLAERWNGTNWAIQPALNPAGARDSYLEAVSCTTPTACTAVGQYYNSSGVLATLAERWNGTNWAIQPTPNPAGATFSHLNGVSCTTSTACAAVGGYVSSSASGTLAERWNGTVWAIQPTPNPAGGTDDSLDAVSCTASTTCTAAGTYLITSVTDVTLAEAWNGTAWAIQPTPNPTTAAGGANGELDAVSCAASTTCTAVGYYGNGYLSRTLAETK